MRPSVLKIFAQDGNSLVPGVVNHGNRICLIRPGRHWSHATKRVHKTTFAPLLHRIAFSIADIRSIRTFLRLREVSAKEQRVCLRSKPCERLGRFWYVIEDP